MQIAIWSAPNITAGTSTITATLSTVIAARYGYKTLMTGTMTSDLSLLSYCSSLYGEAGIEGIEDYRESDMDRLLRLIQHGKLTATDIPNYCYSLLSNSNLDMLGTYRSYEGNQAYQVSFRYLLHQARQFYELIMIDLDKTLEDELAQGIVEESDALIVILPPNTFKQRQILEQLNTWYEKQVHKMEISFWVNGVAPDMSIRKKELAKRCHKFSNSPIAYIPFYTPLIERANDHQMVDYILRHSHDHRKKGENIYLDAIEKVTERLLARKEVQAIGK